MQGIFGFVLCAALTSGKHVDDITEEMAEAYKKVCPHQIKGPKFLNDTIVIVGAGPSGIHMAYLLKQKGFKNVEILEKTNRLGGKSRSIEYRGAVHEMGTVYITADYETSVLNLVNKFTDSKLVAPPTASVWSKYTPNGTPLPHYVFGILKGRYPTLNETQLNKLFVSKMFAYIHLHRSLFGEYIGELMSEPNKAVKRKIKGTFMKFLQRNNLEELKTLLISTFTLQGYGYVEDVPALYGLMWNTPRLLMSIVKVLRGEVGGLYILSKGFENLWRSMVKKSNIKIKYNVDVRYIHLDDNAADIYGDKNKIHVYYRLPGNKIKVKSYDFLIWTPPASAAVNSFGGKEVSVERKLFSDMVNSFYTTSLVDTEGTRRSVSPVDWWFDNINRKQPMSVWAARDSYSTLHGYYGYSYLNALTPSANDSACLRTSVVYQYSKTKPRNTILNSLLTKHLKDLGTKKFEVKAIYSWPYFSRFNQRNAEKGYHWRVLNIQGFHKVWFAGSSVCFESVKSIVEYNQLLISRMIGPI